MTLVKFANGQKNRALNPLFTDVFDSILNDTFLSEKLVASTPSVNIAETENEFHIEMAAPGLNKEDFKISVEKNILSISAEKKTEENAADKRYSKREFGYNSFVRTFTLPDAVDHSKIEAQYSNGILMLNIAKKEEAKIQAREIAVK